MNPGEYEHLALNEEQLWWFRGMRRMTDLLLDRECGLGHGARVLEAGCGTGYEAERLGRRRGWSVVPVDLSPVAVAHALGRGLNAAQADILSLPFADGRFDGVISLDVLVHLNESAQSAAISEFARVLRTGGCLLLRVAALPILRSRHSEWAGERERVRMGRLRAAVRRAGFEVRFTTYANSLLLPVALLKFRVWEPLVRAPVASGVSMPPAWLNTLLEVPLRAEYAWLRLGGRFPLGQSAFVVGWKR